MEGGKRKRGWGVFVIVIAVITLASPARADRISELEETVAALTEGLKAIKRELADERDARREREIDDGLRFQSIEESGLENQQTVSGLQSLLDESSRLKFGGYGSVRYENGNGKLPSTFTFRRFVLTTDVQVNDRLSFFSEIEYERFSELELEKEVFKIAEQDDSGRITKGLGFKQGVEGSHHGPFSYTNTRTTESSVNCQTSGKK